MACRRFLCLVVALTTATFAWPQQVPPQHSHKNYSGNGWECDKGYTRSGDGCAIVAVPANATLNYSGHGWECNRGYTRSGDGCSAVALPANATLNYSGHGWECRTGYIKRGQSCVTVADATDDEVRQLMIAQSISSYPGNCPCPYFVDRAGHSCGARSAYSRPGGYSPLCYKTDISAADVARFRSKYQ